jgi:sugar phosphate isomerase/epimerase
VQLGIFSKTFEGTNPTELFAACRRAGYSGVQFNWACAGLSSLPHEIPAAAIMATADAAKENDVEIFAVSGTYNMIHPNPATRAAGASSLNAIIESADKIGTNIITLCTGSRDAGNQWRHHPDNGNPEAWKDLLISMEQAIRAAEENEVILGIEPEMANIVNSAETAVLLLDELQSNRIRIVFDAANLFEAANFDKRTQIIDEALNLLGDKIVIAHAKDRRANGEPVAAGQGVIDYDRYIAGLRQVGFDGPLVTHGLIDDEAPDVATFLSNLLHIDEETA